MRARLGFAGVALVVLAGCGPARISETMLSGQTMGSDWTVKLAGPLPGSETGLREGIQSRLDAVVAQMSTFERGSDLSRFNAHAEADWQKLPPELFTVLAYALELAAATDGHYDVTAGPLVNLWGFGPEPRGRDLPTPRQIDAAMKLVGWQRVQLDAQTQSARRPGGTYVDLSSLAKGFGVDEVADYLDAQGIRNYLIDLSGKLRAKGRNAQGETWQVAIEQPGPDLPDGGPAVTSASARLDDEAIATAGNYRRRFIEGGGEYSHLLDPKSGRPIDHEVSSVTVLAEDCMTADAWATALIVMPPAAARALVEARGLAAVFVLDQQENSRLWTSHAWRERREGAAGLH